MRHKGSDIRPKIQILKMLEVILWIIPGHCLGTLSKYGLRYILDASKTVNDRFLTVRLLGAKTGTKTAITHQHRCRPMPNNFLQRWRHLDFKIKMGMNVQHTRQQPLVTRIDALGCRFPRQITPTCCYHPVLYRHILDATWCALTIKYLSSCYEEIPLRHDLTLPLFLWIEDSAF